MHTTSVLVAALAAAATVVSAAEGPQRPKIYFPRHLKRQYSNITITTDSPASQATQSDAALDTTTKRDSITDLFASFSKSSFTEKPSFTDQPIFITSTSNQPSSADSTDSIGSPDSTGAQSDSSGSAPSVTTIIVDSTVVVPPSTDPTPASSAADPITAPTPTDSPADVSSDVASTGGIPATIILPTSSVPPTASADTPSATASPSADPSSSGLFSSGETSLESTSTSGILLAPTGIVTSTSEEPSPTPSDPLAPIGSILSTIVSDVTSAVLPSPNVTDTASTAPVTSTPASASAEPTDSASPSAEPTGSSPESEQPSATATLDPTPSPTSSPDGINLSLSLFPGTGSSTIVDTTSPITEEPTGQPTAVIPLPITNGTDTSIPTLITASVGPADTALPPNTTSEPTNTGLQSTAPPVSGNTTATEPPQSDSTPPATVSGTTISDVTATPTTEPTLLPTISTISPNGTSSGNTTIPEETVTQLPPPPTTTSSLSSLSSISVPSITSIATASGVTSIEATATLSGTETTNWLPTTIVVDSPPTGTTTQRTAPTASASGLPASLPKAITPNSDNTGIPPDTTIIGITFQYPLNYDFVANNGMASAQIFNYLPMAVAGTGDFDPAKVQMFNLGPLLTTESSLGYIATVAKLTYPTNLIDQLRLQIKAPNSPLYNHREPIVKNLTEQINPAIDILTFALDGSSAPGSGSGSSAGSSGGVAGSDPLSGNGPGETKSTPGQQGTTAGIALGVIGVAGAYGAAMFIVARRYKRKKQAHRRTSSMTDPSEMRSAAGSPHLMGGALLSRDFSSYGGVAGGRNSHGTQGSGRSGANNSARTAYISGPMAAENSLGWN